MGAGHRGNWVDENDDASRRDPGSRLEWTALTDGEYYLGVSSFDQSVNRGTYSLSLNVAPDSDRHGDTCQNATSISTGLHPGAIDPPSDKDYFHFSAQAGTNYTIDVLLGTHTDTVLTIYDSLCNWMDSNDDASETDTGSHLEWTAPSTGDYYLEVSSFDMATSTGSYTLSLEVTSPPVTLSGFYAGTETSDAEGTSAEFLLTLQETDGTVTGFVQIAEPHVGTAPILDGNFFGETLSFDTGFSEGQDQFECSYAAVRQPDQQTLIGAYTCSILGTTFTDTGTWFATKVETQ